MAQQGFEPSLLVPRSSPDWWLPCCPSTDGDRDGDLTGCLPVLVLQGAFWGLMVGLAAGLARLGLEFAHPTPRCGISDERPSILRDIHYLHFAVLLCALTAVVVVGVSLLTDPPMESQVSPGAWGHPPEPHGMSPRISWTQGPPIPSLLSFAGDGAAFRARAPLRDAGTS